MAYLVYDDFNRSDSNTVGAGAFGGTWTEMGTSAGNERIVSNQLDMGSNGTEARLCVDVASITYPVSLSCYVKASNNTARFGFNAADAGISGNHISINFAGGAGNFVLAANNGATTTSATESLTGADRWIWLDVQENGSNIDLQAYISATSTKPGSATLTLTNVANSTGTKCGLIYASNSASNILKVDDFLFQDSSPFTMTAAVGSFTLTGIASTLTSARRITAAVGSFILSGGAAFMRKVRWVTQSKSSTTWSNQEKS